MIKIGNNNKINKSIIGSDNKIEKEKDKKYILTNIIIPIIVGLIIAGIVFLLKWN
ncbi:unknown [Clostridium sp. CAG:762]|nr:unknown [Clostridium sp. CAG:762]